MILAIFHILTLGSQDSVWTPPPLPFPLPFPLRAPLPYNDVGHPALLNWPVHTPGFRILACQKWGCLQGARVDVTGL